MADSFTLTQRLCLFLCPFSCSLKTSKSYFIKDVFICFPTIVCNESATDCFNCHFLRLDCLTNADLLLFLRGFVWMPQDFYRAFIMKFNSRIDKDLTIIDALVIEKKTFEIVNPLLIYLHCCQARCHSKSPRVTSKVIEGFQKNSTSIQHHGGAGMVLQHGFALMKSCLTLKL